ncbi:MAG: DNA mismatch repair protein MutL, partial [Flavobacteriaceae bacterium]|nr:DNA mismatch repair protein MutL [Flavobacteriaceae bacterium]
FNLSTKGFRGEALASIAAIAHVDMFTRLASEELGNTIKIEGGKIISQGVDSCNLGTSILVKNMFYNIPARRKFLKSDTVESRHILDEFHRVALSHPDISFIYIHNDREVYNLKQDNLRKRIVSIFGTKTNEKLIPIEEDTDIVSIQGFIGKPEFSKKKRGEQFFFVNGRYIKSGYLHHAVNLAYEDLLPKGNTPSYFLYFTVPPDSIDINIHPTKTEIKFDNDQAMYSMLRSTIKHSLGQYNISPVLDFDKNSNLETPYEYKDKEIENPFLLVDRTYNPFESSSVRDTSFGSVSKGSFDTELLSRADDEHNNPNLNREESLYSGTDDGTVFGGSSEGDDFSSDLGVVDSLYSGTQKVNIEYENRIYDSLVSGETQGEESVLESGSLYSNFGEDDSEESSVLFEKEIISPVFEDSFQVKNKYLLCNSKSGIMLVHQHLAHQRVLYEQLLETITIAEVLSQQLLFPITIELSVSDIISVEELRDDLEGVGFSFDIEGDNMLIKGIPPSIKESHISGVIEGLLSDISDQTSHNSFSQLDTISRSMAKNMAIKTGDSLTKQEQKKILEDLFKCKETTLSPYGKRIMREITISDLDNILK